MLGAYLRRLGWLRDPPDPPLRLSRSAHAARPRLEEGMREQLSGAATRLLLIEDDQRFGRALVAALNGQGFDVEWSQDGLRGLDLALGHAWGAVILDLMIPTLNGPTVLRRLREESQVPVLVLTARHSLQDRVDQLDHGADDYLTKPVELPELVARLRALIRRAAGSANQSLTLGDLEIDLYQRLVHRQGQRIELTSTEFRLLEHLIRNRGRAVATGEIARVVSGSGDLLTAATVRAHVRNLRSKLGDSMVQTRRGYGYLVPDQTQ